MLPTVKIEGRTVIVTHGIKRLYLSKQEADALADRLWGACIELSEADPEREIEELQMLRADCSTLDVA